MIGKLRGLVDSVTEDTVILDVGGVGYLLQASSRCLGNLPKSGESVSLFIETHLREDSLRLYGFASEAEREWFKLLQSVQGVGAKVALAILSVLEPDVLASSLAGGDKAMIGRAPGVGPKLAARLVSELKDKVGALSLGIAAGSSAAAQGVPSLVSQDAISALVNLGYPAAKAASVIASLQKTQEQETQRSEMSTATLIRLGLRELARQ
jgi:holliday junction DNA helicase RuvA